MAAPASASVLFDSGAPGARQAHLIASDYWITNLFKPAIDGTARGVRLALWVGPGDYPVQLNWALEAVVSIGGGDDRS